MKKFSNIEQKEKMLSEQKPKFNKIVDKLISENLQVTYNGNLEEMLNKKFDIIGSDKLVEGINDIIENYKSKMSADLFESLKYKYGKSLDQKFVNEEIKNITKNLYSNIATLPHDIFSDKDYIQLKENTIELKSMNNIPTDYMDFININEANKFFENSNIIKIKSINKSWEVVFENSNNYGISTNDKYDKYQLFLKENKEFIASFISATCELIGNVNILLERRLVNEL